MFGLWSSCRGPATWHVRYALWSDMCDVHSVADKGARVTKGAQDESGRGVLAAAAIRDGGAGGERSTFLLIKRFGAPR